MKILAPTPENIALAAAALRAGDVVGMPTETVYGLAGIATDERALAKIFSVKERPTFDPLICHLATTESRTSTWLDRLREANLVDDAKLAATTRSLVEKLTAAFWPGPLTLVLPKLPAVPDLATSGLSTVAVRSPRHPVAQRLLQAVGQPLAAPSANRFGRISPTSPAHVAAELGDRVDYVLDGGPCDVGIESTVLLVEPDGKLHLLRPGGVTAQMITDATGQAVAAGPLLAATASPLPSPGLLASHYAPQKSLHWLERPLAQYAERERVELLAGCLCDGCASVLVFDPAAESTWRPYLRAGDSLAVLSTRGDIAEAARHLFAMLRSLDDNPLVDYLIAEALPTDQGLAHAINDRLRRASHEK